MEGLLESDVGPKLLTYLQVDDLKSLKKADPAIIRNALLRHAHFSEMAFNVANIVDDDNTNLIEWIDRILVFDLPHFNWVLSAKNNLIKNVTFDVQDWCDINSIVSVLSTVTNLTHLTINVEDPFYWEDDLCDTPFYGLTSKSLTHLTFEDGFDSPIINLNTPNLTHLTFCDNFDRSIIALYLPNLLELEYGDHNEQPIIGFYAPKLERLSLGCSVVGFDAPELRYLHFGSRFNQSISGFNAPNLKMLSLPGYFTQPIDGLYAPCLEYVRLGNHYRRPISLPNLKTLVLMTELYDFTEELPCLTHLILRAESKITIRLAMFPSLEKITYVENVYLNGNYDIHHTIEL